MMCGGVGMGWGVALRLLVLEQLFTKHNPPTRAYTRSFPDSARVFR